jgi:hypothetical protein
LDHWFPDPEWFDAVFPEPAGFTHWFPEPDWFDAVLPDPGWFTHRLPEPVALPPCCLKSK